MPVVNHPRPGVIGPLTGHRLAGWELPTELGGGWPRPGQDTGPVTLVHPENLRAGRAWEQLPLPHPRSSFCWLEGWPDLTFTEGQGLGLEQRIQSGPFWTTGNVQVRLLWAAQLCVFNSHLRTCSLILRERGKERKRNIDRSPPVSAPTRDRTHDLLVAGRHPTH